MVSLFGLDHNVVYVGLNGLPDEVSETLEHTTLVRSPCVLQTEHHCDIAERSEQGDEGCRKLIGLFHRDLMVPRVHIKKAKGFTPLGRVGYLVYMWQRKWILWTRLVETHVVNTHSTFPTLFCTRTGLANHSG